MSDSQQIISSPREMRRHVAELKHAGETIGLVPTMGALHEGHLSLVRAAWKECTVVVVSIFVNPTQFAPGEDLDKYPRPLEQDLEQLRRLNVGLVFTPTPAVMYPEGYSTYVTAADVAGKLEGEKRPTHFQGVTTVCAKLFNIIPADYGYFGQKDFQQALVIQRMVEDLNFGIRIRICPIVREPDSLAMSSRNIYLSEPQRKIALSLYRALQAGKKLIETGEHRSSVIRAEMEQILTDSKVTEIDYVMVADPNSLESLKSIDGPAVLLVAAFVGKTRLIDNLLIDGK